MLRELQLPGLPAFGACMRDYRLALLHQFCPDSDAVPFPRDNAELGPWELASAADQVRPVISSTGRAPLQRKE